MSRSIRSVFHAWKKVVVLARQKECGAQQWHCRFRMRACFRFLVQRAESCRQQKVMEKQHSLELQSRCFMAWKASWLMHLRLMQNVKLVMKRKERRLGEQALKGWAHVASQRLKRIAIIQRLHRRWERRKCIALLRAWAQRAAAARLRAKAWARARTLIGLQLQQLCFSAWWKVVFQLKLIRSRAACAHNIRSSQSMRSMFYTWKRVVAQCQQQRQICIQASTSRLLALLARVWEAWTVLWIEGKRRKRAAAASYVEWRQRCLAAAFRVWLHRSKLQKYQHMLLQGAHLCAFACTFTSSKGAAPVQRTS
jgi:hypothetical protein